jgi:hypothetical protein
MCIDDGCTVESAKCATKQDLCKNRSDFAKKKPNVTPNECAPRSTAPRRLDARRACAPGLADHKDSKVDLRAMVHKNLQFEARVEERLNELMRTATHPGQLQ